MVHALRVTLQAELDDYPNEEERNEGHINPPADPEPLGLQGEYPAIQHQQGCLRGGDGRGVYELQRES
jgi:hypothetical protein